MRRKISVYSGLVGTFMIALLTIATAPLALAQSNLSIQQGANSARGVDQAADLFGASGIFTTLSNVLLFLVGAISVIMIIIGGLRYVISGGNSANVTAAKNTILYAIVGIIVAVLAYAIINFVIGSFTPGGGGTNV
jgi:hypothetical protein